ncbi:MAG: hypothetical protein QOD66_2172 [Solirubrobacteraceae bacterium]|nr:hypothetical protein [Solirubrobacteraceae bacterium]
MFVSVARTRSPEDVRLVLALKAAGQTDREVSLLTGVPVNTIRLWRRRGLSRRAARAVSDIPFCAACGEAVHEFEKLPRQVYAYLLGLYLGDGCVGRSGTSWVLRIALDMSYPGIITECCDAIELVRGRRPRPRPDHRGQLCVRIDSGWKQWPCFFPQHGAGRKHLRKIELVPWQNEIVDAEPSAFLRGLIHSDGWRGVNRVHVKGRDYEYPRYQFSNRSDDIRKLFTDACDRLGVSWRPWTRYHVSVAQRESVAILDSFIGPKT